jgi:hypothetical protein
MAFIRSIDMAENNEIQINLSLTKEEYGLLGQRTEKLILLPMDEGSLNKKLTTGKLGNSSRVMLPKKLLGAVGIPEPDKKVKSNFFRVNGDTLLLIKLSESMQGIPVFGEEYEKGLNRS